MGYLRAHKESGRFGALWTEMGERDNGLMEETLQGCYSSLRGSRREGTRERKPGREKKP